MSSIDPRPPPVETPWSPQAFLGLTALVSGSCSASLILVAFQIVHSFLRLTRSTDTTAAQSN